MTELKKVEKPVDTLTRMLSADSVKKQFQNCLGKHSDQFTASIIDLFNGDTAIQECNQGLLIKECLKGATLGLPINKSLGFGYIVPFNKKDRDANGNEIKVKVPQFIIGYKGYIQLAMRTGQYQCINTDLVYEGELQGFDKLTGEINLNGQKTSDKVVGYFAHIRLTNGFQHTLYMSVKEMAIYAKRFSKGISYKTTAEMLENLANVPTTSGKVGWEGDFNAMAQKTCLRRLLSKYGFLSIEMQQCLETDVKADAEEVADNSAPKDVIIDTAFEEVKSEEQTQTSEPSNEPSF